jgi:hypothetical protein
MSPLTLLPERTEEQREKTASEEIQVDKLVARASAAIAPLWPIRTFIARHPWMNLETLTFEEVAYRFKTTQHLDLFPSMSMLRAALHRGELDPGFLEMRFQRWLDKHALAIPRSEAEHFFRQMLWNDKLPATETASEKERFLACIKESGAAYLNNPWIAKPKSALLQERHKTPWPRILDQQMIKWCKLFLDESQALWPMPYREKGFYHAWWKLVCRDPFLRREQRKRLEQLPDDAEEALQLVLRHLGIQQEEMEGYLRAHLLSLPGWAGMLLWRSQTAGQDHKLLIDYLAIRLSLEWALVAPYLPVSQGREDAAETLLPTLAAWMKWGGWTTEKWLQLPPAQQRIRLSLAERFDKVVRQQLWLEAWEDTQEAKLKNRLTHRYEAGGSQKLAAQLLFCIDVRSEPFRRHLEREGPFETFGCAGFFGLPVQTRQLGNGEAHASCPPIVKPQHEIRECAPAPEIQVYFRRHHTLLMMQQTFKKMKQQLLPSLLLPEMSGPFLGLAMLARTFLPDWAPRFLLHQRQRFLRKPETRLTLHRDGSGENGQLPVGFSLEEKIRYASDLLRSIGLTASFAPLVVVCGHGSETTNNPYASALDCGACGGAAGGLNARLLAELCNLKEVREGLAKEGIVIPEDTVFVAAEHNTTVNQLRWLHVPALSETAQKALVLLQEKLREVSRKVNLEQMSKLPGVRNRVHDPFAEACRRAADWSEIRPEWGLAGNMAMVIGRRRLTKDCDLEGKVFLHSYDWHQDPDGELLAQIVAGPVTVAQWINLQYYASTVAPHYYGSGDKTTQTVTAGIGVMQGNASDLLSGLPWQSVMASDQEAFHSPLRLLVIVEAPRHFIARLLEQDRHFCRKVKNGWLRLVSIEPEHGKWIRWEPEDISESYH